MKKYYYAVGKKKFGPLSIDDLLEKNLDPDTLIWFDGLPDWAPLSSFPEFDNKTNNQPPPLKFNENQNAKSYTKIIISIIFGLLVIGSGIGIYVYPKIQADKKFDNALEVFKNTDSISYDVFKELAEQNYPKSHFILGLYYDRLDDSISAKKMFEKALFVDKDIAAYYWLVIRLDSKVGKDTLTTFNGPFYKNLENWVSTIEPSDWLGQLSAAWIYPSGKESRIFEILKTEKGENLSDEEFLIIQRKMKQKYLELAANNGSVLAMEMLGSFWETRNIQTADFDKAIFWYKKAAESGYPEAMASLGDIYTSKERHSSKEIEDMYNKISNNEEAKKWLSLAVKNNSDIGYYNMAGVFQEGLFGEINLDSAEFYFNKVINHNGNKTELSSLWKVFAIVNLNTIETLKSNSYRQEVQGSGSNSTSNTTSDWHKCEWCGRKFTDSGYWILFGSNETTINRGGGYAHSSGNFCAEHYCSVKCANEKIRGY